MGAVAEPGERLGRPDAADDRGGELPRVRARSGGQGSGLAVAQPFGDAAGCEADRRDAGGRRFEADETERLRPEAGNDEGIGRREQPRTPGFVLPAVEPDFDPRVCRTNACGPAFERGAFGTVAGDDEADSADAGGYVNERVDQAIDSLEWLQPSEIEQPAR